MDAECVRRAKRFGGDKAADCGVIGVTGIEPKLELEPGGRSGLVMTLKSSSKLAAAVECCRVVDVGVTCAIGEL